MSRLDVLFCEDEEMYLLVLAIASVLSTTNDRIIEFPKCCKNPPLKWIDEMQILKVGRSHSSQWSNKMKEVEACQCDAI